MQFILWFASVHFEMGGYIIIKIDYCDAIYSSICQCSLWDGRIYNYWKKIIVIQLILRPSRYSWNIVESGDKHQTIDSSVFTLRWEICYCSNNSWYMYVYIYVSPPLFATPLKLLNRISWNLVGSKDTICSCAYYQEILITWILWELCPFELRNFPKFTTEAACQRNSSETTEQNFMKLCR
jgi:hypothetical protein